MTSNSNTQTKIERDNNRVRVGNGRKRAGQYRSLEDGSAPWVWAEDLHGGISELAQGELPLTEGRTEPVGKWTFHDAYCGIGGMGSGLALAGGVCTGAFESDRVAREVYQQRVHHQPDGAWDTFDPQKWSKARVLVSAPPCEDVPWLIGKNEDRQMWKHLRLG